MRAKSLATSLLFGGAILSLPLCLVPIILWGGAAVPWMVADFTVANHSGETVYITPVTISPVAILQRYSMGQLRAFRQADIRLPPIDLWVLHTAQQATRFKVDLKY